MSDRSSDRLAASQNRICASDPQSDRLFNHRILIGKASTDKCDDQCSLQLSEREVTAVESQVDTPISLEVIRKAQGEDDSIQSHSVSEGRCASE